MRSKQKNDILFFMIQNVYFLYNYSINCWGCIDPEAQRFKQETKTI